MNVHIDIKELVKVKAGLFFEYILIFVIDTGASKETTIL